MLSPKFPLQKPKPKLMLSTSSASTKYVAIVRASILKLGADSPSSTPSPCLRSLPRLKQVYTTRPLANPCHAISWLRESWFSGGLCMYCCMSDLDVQLAALILSYPIDGQRKEA
jgi:hypothetical protein